MLPDEDTLLLLIDSPGADHRLDRIRIMKGMFLLSREVPDLGLTLDFKPYDWGPFSPAVYRQLENLTARGLIASEAGLSRRYESYKTTTEGRRAAEFVATPLPQHAVEHIRAIKTLVTSLSFIDLLDHVYKRYPAFAQNTKLR